MSRWRWAICVFGLWAGGGCHLGDTLPQPESLVYALQAGNAALPAMGAPVSGLPGDDELWRRSRDAAAVSAGQAAFNSSSCRTCHAVSLTGGPGPSLADQRWLHGGTPREVFQTIARGVPSRTMPAWGPVLGPAMIADIVAFIFSFHREGESIEIQTSFTPTIPVYD